MARPDDRFANIAASTLIAPAADTIAFQEILTGISLGQRMGMIIDQIDYFPASATIRELVDNTDLLLFGLTSSNDVDNLWDTADRRVIHSMELLALVSGVPATMVTMKAPYTYQFFPPIIIAAPRLYLSIQGAGMAAAGTIRMRLYFRFIELAAQEYLELAETFVLTG